MTTLKEQYVELLGNVAADYHRDFKHDQNMKHASATSWRECTAPRCERFQRLIAAFPGTEAEQAALLQLELRALKVRVDSALLALGDESGDRVAKRD